MVTFNLVGTEQIYLWQRCNEKLTMLTFYLFWVIAYYQDMGKSEFSSKSGSDKYKFDFREVINRHLGNLPIKF